jgi:iron complex transport system ATP-binding protein
MTGDLHVRDFSAGYSHRKVLSHLRLDPIRPGHITSLVGPNGAGKSTLLRAIGGLMPSEGSLRLGDRDLSHAPLAERTRYISFMPQVLPQPVALTVLETTMNALMVAPRSGARPSLHDAHLRSMAVLERIGIADIALERLDRLSGGQRQLASLAQAIVREPELLLLDEPTSALDLRHQVLVMSLVRDFAREGRIAIVVLHDLNLAARWSEHIVVLRKGQVHVAGSPEVAFTPQMLGDVYQVEARVEPCSLGSVQILVDGPKG